MSYSLQEQSSSSETAESPPTIGSSMSNGRTNPLPLRRCLPPPSSCITTQATIPFPSFLTECDQAGGSYGASENNPRNGHANIFSKSSAFMRKLPSEVVQQGSAAEFSPIPLLKTLSGSSSRSHLYETMELSVDNTSESSNGSDDAEQNGYESDSDCAGDITSVNSDEIEKSFSNEREVQHGLSPKVESHGEKSINNCYGYKAMQLHGSEHISNSGNSGSDEESSSDMARPWSTTDNGNHHDEEVSSGSASSCSGDSASISETSHCPGRGVDLVLETSALSDVDDEASSTDAAVVQCNQSGSDSDEDDSSDDDENTISSDEDSVLASMDGVEQYESASSLHFVIESDDLQKTFDDINDLGSLGSHFDDCSQSEEYIDLRFNEEIEDEKVGNDDDYNIMEGHELSDCKDRANIDSEFERALDDSDQDDAVCVDYVISANEEELGTTPALLSSVNPQNHGDHSDASTEKIHGEPNVFTSCKSGEESILEGQDVSQVVEQIEFDEGNMNALAEALEFDFWTTKLFRNVVDFLKKSLQRRSVLSLVLPPSTDTTFWVDGILDMVMPGGAPLFENLNNRYLRERVSKLLYNAFHDEITSADVTLLRMSLNDPFSTKEGGRVFVGSMNSAESRLAMALLGVKHIIIIASHPPDELWAIDSIKYSIHVLPSCNDQTPTVSDIVEACAVEVADFLECNSCRHEEERGSILVACSTGNEHACAVGATFLANSLEIDAGSAVDMMRQLRPAASVELSWMSPTWQMFSPPPAPAHLLTPLSKRMLSSQKLSQLDDVPKRARCSLDRHSKLGGEEPHAMPDLPPFSLGDSHADKQALKCLCDGLYVLSQNEAYKANEDDAKQLQQQQLTDELNERADLNRSPSASPVPLLTPPMTPQHVSGNDVIVEWPSNLNVDVAITSSMDLPIINLQELEQLGASGASKTGLHTSQPSIKVLPYDDVSTGLTPRLSSINFDHSYI